MSVAFRWAGLMLWGLAAAAMAQSEGARKPQWSFDARISTQLTASDNAALASSASGRYKNALLEVTPGFRLVAATPRVQGFLDYGLTARTKLRGERDEAVWQALNGAGTAELVEKAVYVDASGVINRQQVSAYGTPVTPLSMDNTNQTQTISGTLSPYIKGDLLHSLSYELRYAVSGVITHTQTRSDSLGQSGSAKLSQTLGRGTKWALSWSEQVVNYSHRLEDDKFSSANLTVSQGWDQWTASVLAGRESRSQMGQEAPSSLFTGGQLEWRPTSRTQAGLSLTHHDYGQAHTASLSHRFGQGALRFSDSQQVITQPSALVTASLGSVHDLLDQELQALEPDPVARAALVDAVLQRQGLPANMQVTQTYTLSRAVIQRSQELSWVNTWPRQSLSLMVNQTSFKSLQRLTSALGDDLDTVSSVRVRGFGVSLAHRLAPLTTATLSWNAQMTGGGASEGVSAQRSRSSTLSLATSTGRQTSVSASLRHTDGVAASGRYRETAFIGNLSHHF